eukprot:gene9679-11476_t
MSSAISSTSVQNLLSVPQEDIPEDLEYIPKRSVSAPQPSHKSKSWSAFISYRRDNIDVVEKIVMEIEEKGFSCFYDLGGEMTGYRFMTALIQKILSSSAFVPVITMDSIIKLTHVDVSTTDITLVEYLIALSRRGVDELNPRNIIIPIVVGEDRRDHNGLVAYSNLFRDENYQTMRKQLANVVPETCVEKARSALKVAGLDMPEAVSHLTVRQIWDYLVSDMDCFILGCAKQDAKAQIQFSFVERLRAAVQRKDAREVEAQPTLDARPSRDTDSLAPPGSGDSQQKSGLGATPDVKSSKRTVSKTPLEGTGVRHGAASQDDDALYGRPLKTPCYETPVEQEAEIVIEPEAVEQEPEWEELLLPLIHDNNPLPPQRSSSLRLNGNADSIAHLLSSGLSKEQQKALKHLNLNENTLAALPDCICELSALRFFGAAQNLLTAVPEQIGKLTALQHLTLTGNKLEALPECVGELVALKFLDISVNRLSALPERFSQLSALEHLEASFNNFRHCPEGFFKLSALRYLSFGRNKISSLPDDWDQLRLLEHLDFAVNSLITLPESIGQLRSLTRLSVVVNRLEVLPASLRQLQALRHLDASHNRLSEVSDRLGDLTSLETLALRSNRLSCLPQALSKLTRLQQCAVGGNSLSSFPKVLCEIRSLTDLSLSANLIATIPQRLTELTSLRHLALCSNRVRELPEGMDALTKLESLVVSNNKLVAISDEICHLTALQTLSLGRNSLSALPSPLGALTRLQILEVCGNHISELPDICKELTGLEHLDLSSNLLTTLPDMGQMNSLKILTLHHNPLVTVVNDLSNLGMLTQLFLTGTKLHTFPPCVCELHQLTKLDVSRNSIKTLPANLGMLTELRTFDISDNNIVSLPTSLGEATHMECFSVRDNQLSMLPEDVISRWSELLDLDVGSNNLEYLPANIQRLVKMQALDFSCNKVSVLPGTLCALPEVAQISASRNRLKALPKGINQLRKLRFLDVSCNELMALPQDLGELTSLEELDASENRHLHFPPPQVLELGAQGVVKYLANLSVSLGDPFKHTRFMMLGEGPKTAINHAIRKRHPEFGTPFGSSLACGSTSCITIDEWRPDGDFVGHIWEYVGKGDFKTLHQIFVASQTVNVLVWELGNNLEEAKESVGSWLQSVQWHQPESAVVLVATHKDNNTRVSDSIASQQIVEMNRFVKNEVRLHAQRQEQWKQALEEHIRSFCTFLGIYKFTTRLRELDSLLKQQIASNLIDKDLRRKLHYMIKLQNPVTITLVNDGVSCEVDCASGKGVNELKETLMVAASQLPGFGELVPKSYLELLYAIRKKKIGHTRFLTQAQFLEEATLAGIPPGPKLEAALKFLCRLGFTSCFQSHDFAGLEDKIFIDPQWLANSLNKVVGKMPLYSQDVQVNVKLKNLRERGRLEHSLLCWLWEVESDSLCYALLNLLESFNIVASPAYPRCESIVPCQLDPMHPAEKEHILKHLDYKFSCRVAFRGSPNGFFTQYL